MQRAHDRGASRWSVALLMLVAAAACDQPASSSENSGATGSGAEAIDAVSVGAIPIVEVAPLYLGKQKGFFASRNIDLSITTRPGGATIITGVLGDQLQFGFGNVTSFMMACDKGLQLKILTNGGSSTGEAGKDVGALVVPAGSPIQSARELAGRTVSVNQLNNIGDTTVRASIRRAGGDPKAVKFTAVPFPETQTALDAKQMDAAFVVEPFLSRVIGAGARVISWIFVDTAPNMTIAVYFTSDHTVRTRPDLIRRFTEAMNESLEYAQAHPDEAREMLKTYTKIPPETITALTLPRWPTEVNRDSLKTVADLAFEDGLIASPVDVDALFAARR